MKKLLLHSLYPLAFALVFTKPVKAQDVASDPGAYIDAINNAQTVMNKTYMAYVSEAAHSTRKRKIEKMRVQAVVSITDCRYKIIELPIYKGDNTLRQSSIN